MAAYFFDSSALVKCYIQERGSGWVRSIAFPPSPNDIHALQVIELEVVSAIARRRKGGSLTPAAATAAVAQLRHDVQHALILLDVSELLIADALALADRHELRAYDALHLAAAIDFNRSRAASAQPALTFVSADLELNAAALANGFVVEDPNAHP